MNTPRTFRKKPVVINAMLYTGDNAKQILEWIGAREMCEAAFETMGMIKIPTLEGVMAANKFDWIIQGVKGEFYPCKPDIFQQTYEAVA